MEGHVGEDHQVFKEGKQGVDCRTGSREAAREQLNTNRVKYNTLKRHIGQNIKPVSLSKQTKSRLDDVTRKDY